MVPDSINNLLPVRGDEQATALRTDLASMTPSWKKRDPNLDAQEEWPVRMSELPSVGFATVV